LNAKGDMMDDSERLTRIENLLQEGNRLRSEAIALQKESLAVQKSLVDETRANIVKAGKVNDQALEVQRRAKVAVKVILGIVFILVVYLSYLLFFRLNLP
jgi:t-SNARE complex subunit (syntaxin)